MNYFINSIHTLVDEALEGLCYLYPNRKVSRIDGSLSVSCVNDGRKVKIIIGGGSGHEPLFAGMVGTGMADAAVLGHVFAAPSPKAIVELTKRIAANGEDIVFVYGNYSGDVLNFDLAQEDLEDLGIRSIAIRTHDDITSSPVSDMDGRRGIAGGVFVIKCIAAAADSGLEYEEIIRIAEKANRLTRSIGVAAGAADSIVDGQPMFEIPKNMVEIGMGLHGEKGVHQGEFKSADHLVDEMLQMLFDDFQNTGSEVKQAAVLINGLGRTTLLEQFLVARRVRQVFDQRNISIEYMNAGEYGTSLNMHGFSITIMALDEELKSAILAPAASFGFTIA